MTTSEYHFQFVYKFHNDTKLIYETQIIETIPNAIINFTDTYSFIACNKSIPIGYNDTFRSDGLIFLKISPQNNTQLNYTRNEIIQVGSKYFNTRVFEGKIPTIVDCL